MKIRNNVMISAALCCAVFVLGACNYEDNSGGQGSIRINFDNSNARYTVTDNDKEAMSYTIILTSPDKDTINEKTKEGDTSITITVSEGNWHIEVQAEGKRVTGAGKTDVKVTAGETAPATIKMTVTGTRVSSWSELVTDFKDASLKNHSIEILDNLTTSSTQPLDLKGIAKTITLWTAVKDGVTITRSRNMNNDPVFLIQDCTLILDGTKGGAITIEGNNDTNCTRALINVEKSSTLRILDGVTITKNISAGVTGGGFGGGIYVDDGKFSMEGGVISGNTAKTNGGGVYIKSGTFTKTGGIIYGYDERDSNSNVVKYGNTIYTTNGHAVYFNESKISINTTLGLKDDWPAP